MQLYKFQYQRRQNQISKWNHDEVNDKADPAQEIRRRISSTMPILKRLDIETNRTEAENGNYLYNIISL